MMGHCCATLPAHMTRRLVQGVITDYLFLILTSDRSTGAWWDIAVKLSPPTWQGGWFRVSSLIISSSVQLPSLNRCMIGHCCATLPAHMTRRMVQGVITDYLYINQTTIAQQLLIFLAVPFNTVNTEAFLGKPSRHDERTTSDDTISFSLLHTCDK